MHAWGCADGCVPPAELAGQRTLAIQELSSLLEQMKQIEAQEANLLSVAGDRQAQVGSLCQRSAGLVREQCSTMASQADGLPVDSPSSPAWVWRCLCMSPIPACLVVERGLSTGSTKRADGHMWNPQSALFAELAKIEVQQRTVIQQINSLKSERCAEPFCQCQTSAQWNVLPAPSPRS